MVNSLCSVLKSKFGKKIISYENVYLVVFLIVLFKSSVYTLIYVKHFIVLIKNVATRI